MREILFRGKPADKNIAQSGLAPATENFELMEG